MIKCHKGKLVYIYNPDGQMDEYELMRQEGFPAFWVGRRTRDNQIMRLDADFIQEYFTDVKSFDDFSDSPELDEQGLYEQMAFDQDLFQPSKEPPEEQEDPEEAELERQKNFLFDFWDKHWNNEDS